MKLNKYNPIPVTSRLKGLLGDWLFITAYLSLLFLLAMVFYSLVLGGTPKFTEFQSQLLAFGSSVLPLVLIFAYLDHGKSSWGKRWAGLQLVCSHKSPTRSLLRSAIKFSLGSWDIWEPSVLSIRGINCQASCQFWQGFSFWSF